MKKLILLLAIILISQWVVSQSQFRFGLKIAPSFNWMKPDDVKKFENGGTTLGFNWGLTGEYALSENFSFYSGLELLDLVFQLIQHFLSLIYQSMQQYY